MAGETGEIVAILFSDVVGYAHVSDPEKTAPIIHDQETRNLVRSLTQQYKGDWVQEIGDAVVCTFGNAVAATQCALEIQQGIAEESHFRPRIGIHVGEFAFGAVDIGTDVFRDAVKVAAGVQALSGRGGICITSRVYEELRSNQALLDFDDMGDTSLENIDSPVRVYQLNLPTSPVILSEFATVGERHVQRRSRVPTVVIGLAVLFAIGVGWLLIPVVPEPTVADDVGIAENTDTHAGTDTIAEGVPDAPPPPELSEAERQAIEFAAVREKLTGLAGKSDFAPRVWTIPDPVKDNTIYRVGIEANCDCTALLFAIDGSGDEISLLYPNPFQLDGSLQAGDVLKIPASDEFFLRAVGGEGIDEMKLIVVNGTLDLGIPPNEAWSATPGQTERIAELETMLTAIETLEWDSASAPLQIIP